MEPILAYFRDGVKILDIGCGNGRLAKRLDNEGLRVEYLGIDATRELIVIAAKHRANLQKVRAEFIGRGKYQILPDSGGVDALHARERASAEEALDEAVGAG